jgi:DNA processing protein
VFAIPGSIHSPFSKGCHRLIKEGAKLVETAQDVLEELGLAPAAASAPIRAGTAAAPEGDAARVLEALGHDPVDIDALAERTGLGASAIAVALVELELRGQVAPLPGGAFQRVM